MGSSGESALVVFVPEAEDLVKPFRESHDPLAAQGMPAHITILCPFRHPGEVTQAVVDALEDAFATLPGFMCSLIAPRRFPGVLYLPAMPVERFLELTQKVVDRFPETPPYGGAFAQVIPHLTVATASDERRLDAIAAGFAKAAEGRLPLQAAVQEVVLMDNLPGRWEVRARFPLGHPK